MSVYNGFVNVHFIFVAIFRLFSTCCASVWIVALKKEKEIRKIMSQSKSTSVDPLSSEMVQSQNSGTSADGPSASVIQRIRREIEDDDDNVAINPQTAEKVLGAAKSYLECPVCYETLVSPIYQCQNGHIVCNQCIERLVQCGECRVSLAGSRIRNVALENICKSVDVKCPNKSEGCSVLTTVEMLKNHLEICGYQYAFVI